jgi:enoyl-CoA hydratase/carnithine racemase
MSLKKLGKAIAAQTIGLALLLGAAAEAGPLDDAAAKYTRINIERRGSVLIAKFNNPPQQLMDMTTVAELGNLLTHVEQDAQTRVLIFTGAGDRFIRYFDVGPVVSSGKAGDATLDVNARELNVVHKTLLQMEALSKPTICAINGKGTAGGGLETALACDFRIMASGGQLQFPEVSVGIIPGAGGTQRLPRIIGQARAMEMIMTTAPVDAATAERIGLVNRVVAEDKLMPEAMAIADRLLAQPALSLKIAKRVMHESQGLPLEQGLIVEQEGFAEAISSEETRARFRRP